MTKVIITRAEPGHSQTVNRVAELGFEAVSAPMLDLQANGVSLPDLARYRALLFTSANGVRFFAEHQGIPEQALTLTAYCVGPATLEAAQSAGFKHCQHANGNAQDLADLVSRHRLPSQGKLLHVANAAAAGDLSQSLRNSGFTVDFLPLYVAEPVKKGTAEVTRILAAPEPAIVLIHSAKAAEAFGARYTLPTGNHHKLVAVSAKAAAPLQNAGFAAISVAARPNEASLMDCLSAASSATL